MSHFKYSFGIFVVFLVLTIFITGTLAESYTVNKNMMNKKNYNAMKKVDSNNFLIKVSSKPNSAEYPASTSDAGTTNYNSYGRAPVDGPDLVITQITFSNNGKTANIAVKNIGQADAVPPSGLNKTGIFVIGRYLRDSNPDGGPLGGSCSFSIDDTLKPLDSFTGICSRDDLPADDYEFKAIVDDNNDVIESNEDNNKFSTTTTVS